MTWDFRKIAFPCYKYHLSQDSSSKLKHAQKLVLTIVVCLEAAALVVPGILHQLLVIWIVGAGERGRGKASTPRLRHTLRHVNNSKLVLSIKSHLKTQELSHFHPCLVINFVSDSSWTQELSVKFKTTKILFF